LVHAQNRTTAQLIAELSRDPAVETAEPNYLRWVTTAPPNDTLFTNLWAMQNTGQSVNGLAGTAGDDVHFIAAWALAQPAPPTANRPVVAVIDTGVDYTHPDLASNMWTNHRRESHNGLDDDGDGFMWTIITGMILRTTFPTRPIPVFTERTWPERLPPSATTTWA
jgi:hypothetical protein